MIDNNKLILTSGARLGLFLCIAIVGFFLCSLISVIIISIWGQSTAALRISTVLQNLILFMAPAVITAMLSTKLPADFLQLSKMPTMKQVTLTTMLLILSIPTMNFIVYCNEAFVFPASLSGIEEWLKAMEQTSREQITILLGEPTPMNLIMSILIVGILTGLCEELFFRGALQNIFRTSPMSIHIAIWVTAIIFSALHFQFYGFVPRMLLGAFFGYLAVWSGSLWLPVFAHALNNSMVVISTWLIDRQAITIDVNKLGTDFTATDYAMIAVSVIATSLGIIILYNDYRKKQELKEKV